MTVNYKGKSKDYDYRIAEVCYTDAETALANRLFHFLEVVKGWKINNSVEGWACVEVENQTEYKDFVRDYKTGKTCIKNCIKFGF